MKIVSMYTDGACSGNQNEENVGGWGCILEFAGREKELWDGEVNTTNNRMELSAPIAGLSALKEKGLLVRIYSDSSYLVNCFQQGWHKNWVKNGWKTSQKKPVENRELHQPAESEGLHERMLCGSPGIRRFQGRQWRRSAVRIRRIWTAGLRMAASGQLPGRRLWPIRSELRRRLQGHPGAFRTASAESGVPAATAAATEI